MNIMKHLEEDMHVRSQSDCSNSTVTEERTKEWFCSSASGFLALQSNQLVQKVIFFFHVILKTCEGFMKPQTKLHLGE